MAGSRDSAIFPVNDGSTVWKSEWTGGKIPSMTKGGSMPAIRAGWGIFHQWN